MTTLFSVTGVSNDSFSADIAGKCNVIPKESDEYTGKEELENIDINDYDYGVDYGQNKTKLIMNKMSSFQSANFVMKQKVKNSWKYYHKSIRGGYAACRKNDQYAGI